MFVFNLSFLDSFQRKNFVGYNKIGFNPISRTWFVGLVFLLIHSRLLPDLFNSKTVSSFHENSFVFLENP